jgi:hypothetical protein
VAAKIVPGMRETVPFGMIVHRSNGMRLNRQKFNIYRSFFGDERMCLWTSNTVFAGVVLVIALLVLGRLDSLFYESISTARSYFWL